MFDPASEKTGGAGMEMVTGRGGAILRIGRCWKKRWSKAVVRLES